MKLRNKIAILATLMFSFAGLSLGLASKSNVNVSAAQEYTHPRNSGTILFVNSGAFTEYDLAIYCFNDSTNAWSSTNHHKITASTYRVMLPYKDGQSKTWGSFIVCQYNKGWDPSISGWDGVHAQTSNQSFGSFLYNHNTISVYVESGQLKVSETKSATYYNGIKSNSHLYLDLKNFTGWEAEGAKFGVWFFLPHFTNEGYWGQSNSPTGYYSSFMWKVAGQDNDHLYECIVPDISGYSGGMTIWNGVKVVRYKPNTTSVTWDENFIWNRTQDLCYTSENHESNMIYLTDWDNAGAFYEPKYSISQETRISFFGQYFLDNVTCSGTGKTDATTSAQWELVGNEYKYHLSISLQNSIKGTAGDKEGSTIAQAMARYDYIVFYKAYSHENFIGRSSANPSFANNYLVPSRIDDKSLIVIITLIAGVSLLSLTALIILKKKHK